MYLNLYRSELSPSDIRSFRVCFTETGAIPKLTELVLSYVDTNGSLPFLFDVPRFGCRLSSLFLEVWDEKKIHNSDKSTFEILRCLTLSNIRQLGVQGNCALINKAPHTLQSLVLRNEFVNEISSLNLCNLHHLMISHTLGVTVNLSAVLSQPLPLLSTLVLKNCDLNSTDLSRLSEAQKGNRLPTLKHLDISDNELSNSDLACLFEGPCTWAQLLSLEISGNDLNHVNRNGFELIQALDSPVASGLLPVLEDVTTSSFILHKTTVQWQHLKTLRLFGLARSLNLDLRRFPALLNVCIDTTAPLGTDFASESAEMGVSCHAFVSPDCPFAVHKCVFCHKPEDE